MRAAAFVLVLAGVPALAGPLFDAEEDRYARCSLVQRTLKDLVAIPVGVVDWEGRDWAMATTVAMATALMMVDTPYGASVDLRLQRWLHRSLGPEHLRLWTPIGDPIIWAGIWAPTLGALAWGWLGGSPRLLQFASLTLEAFAVGQLYQLFFKAALGREGPAQGGDRLFGPAGFVRLFPSGTPSGHATTFYAMMSAATAYWQDARLTVGLQLFGLLFCITLVTDDYHYISDVVWGAAMGWAIGQWVVKHRASPEEPAQAAVPTRSLLVPILAPAEGRYGLAWSTTF